MRKIKGEDIKEGDYIKIIYKSGYRIYLALESFGTGTFQDSVKFRIIKNNMKEYEIGETGHWGVFDVIQYKLSEDEVFLSMI